MMEQTLYSLILHGIQDIETIIIFNAAFFIIHHYYRRTGDRILVRVPMAHETCGIFIS